MSAHAFPTTDLCADCRCPIADGERFKLAVRGPLCEICAGLVPPARPLISGDTVAVLTGAVYGLLIGGGLGLAIGLVLGGRI